MKWQTLVLSYLASTTLAAPVYVEPSPPSPVYTLRISGGGPDLDTHYLSASGSVIGVFPDKDNNPIKFYAVPNKDTGLVELHNWAGISSPGSPGSPNTPKTKAIALVGNARTGLMELTSVEDPAAIGCGDGDAVDCEWTSFTLNQGAPTSEGKPANTVSYAGPGGWVAFRSSKVEGGGWVVRWKYPQATTTQDFVPVDLVYEPIFTIADTKRSDDGTAPESWK
ncbi:hypothetical protein B0H65DRAFT_417269 [Neurospora tetraspora]|uniref:Uncharacterized protein n=1 Tax=Neurospora tetraspora TaxID=94610 RepID=A0AAE0JQ79_9PEZI|nr:hypothetical protein B0H65DRAFT_417269 [Neurospora tetraspora]